MPCSSSSLLLTRLASAPGVTGTQLVSSSSHAFPRLRLFSASRLATWCSLFAFASPDVGKTDVAGSRGAILSAAWKQEEQEWRRRLEIHTGTFFLSLSLSAAAIDDSRNRFFPSNLRTELTELLSIGWRLFLLDLQL